MPANKIEFTIFSCHFSVSCSCYIPSTRNGLYELKYWSLDAEATKQNLRILKSLKTASTFKYYLHLLIPVDCRNTIIFPQCKEFRKKYGEIDFMLWNMCVCAFDFNILGLSQCSTSIWIVFRHDLKECAFVYGCI